MKKLLSILLIVALSAATLSGCSLRRRRTEGAEAPEAAATADAAPGYTITDGSAPVTGEAELGSGQPTPEPIETLPPEEIAQQKMEQEKRTSSDETEGEPDSGDIALGAYDDAEESAQHAQPSIIDTSTYQFSAVVDENVDYTFNYPSHWNNVPGIYTICFREPVEDGDFPARIAVTRKRLVHTPDDQALTDQLISYMRSISRQYDRSTFQTSTANFDDRFMGTRAFSNTYLAYWGDIEVKGFVIGCAIERTMYILHFSASYSDYLALSNVLKYMVQSVHQKEQPKKK